MGEIVNLRTARKRKAREADAREAEQNRLRHGRTKADTLAGREGTRKLNQHLDGHRLPPTEDGTSE